MGRTVFALQPRHARAEARLATAGHWAYVVALGALKVPWAVAGTLYFLIAWAADRRQAQKVFHR
jgi:hypothetical protein